MVLGDQPIHSRFHAIIRSLQRTCAESGLTLAHTEAQGREMTSSHFLVRLKRQGHGRAPQTHLLKLSSPQETWILQEGSKVRWNPGNVSDGACVYK